jgi:hypothetical protein
MQTEAKMRKVRSTDCLGPLALFLVIALTMSAFRVSNAAAQEPIVGLWQITVKDSNGNVVDSVFSGWTSDGLEFDQDISPILTGYVCYGHWVKLTRHTYALTHPFFTYMDPNSNGEGTESTEGFSDGNSGYFNYVVTVANNGQSFTGRENVKTVKGLNPYDPNATVIGSATGLTLSATKIQVNQSLLP